MMSQDKGKGCPLQQGCVLICVVLVTAGVIQTYRNFREAATESKCRASLETLAGGTLRYAMEHDYRLPTTNDWLSVTTPGTEEIDSCPARSCPGEVGYAMSPSLSGADLRKIPHPESTILLYEACGGASEYRHRGGMNVAYADGHVAWIPGPKR
jgi:prepilin-type processing-associated H-X9-DG protein